MAIGARPIGTRAIGDSTNQVLEATASAVTLRHKSGGTFINATIKHKTAGAFTAGVVRHKTGGTFVP